MTTNNNTDRDLILLEQIEKAPDSSQATLAQQLGVAVGTINWHLKRLIAKGYIKVRRTERRKLHYIITPEGITLRARLTVDYIQNSFRLYHLVRQRVKENLDEVKKAGFTHARLIGDGELAEICRLTCLEQGVQLVEDQRAPALKINGLKIFVEWD